MDLIILAVVAFVQNMAFTLVSRSRNAGDVSFHAVAAVFSNGVWFATFSILTPKIMHAIETRDAGVILLTGLVYTLATTVGSCLMMWVALRTEKGKRRVGAR